MPDLVSIVVPTYNRPLALARLLDALADQVAGSDVEVLVVDDGSTVPGVAEVVVNRGHRYLKVPNGGPGVARNLGWRTSAGAVVVFVDDDVVPEPTWLEALVRVFEDPEVVGAGGRILPLADNAMSAFVQAERLADHAVDADGTVRYLVTASAAYRRPVLEAVGGFSTAFPAGVYGEDVDLSYRARAHGRLVVVREAVVRHEHRTSIGALLRTYRLSGRGRRVLATRHPSLSLQQGAAGVFSFRHWTDRYNRYRDAGVGGPVAAVFLGLHGLCMTVFLFASLRRLAPTVPPADVVLLNDVAEVGGGQQVTLDVARALDAMGHSVIVASPPGWLADRSLAAGLNHVPFEFGDRRMLHPRLRIPRVLGFLRRCREIRDLRRLMARSGAKTLHTMATIPHVDGSLASFGVPWRVVWHLNQIGPPGLAALPAPDRCLAPSRAALAVLRRRRALHRRAIVAPNAVDVERFRPPTPDERRRARARFGVADQELVVSCAARLEPLKGIHHLLEATAGLSDLVVLVAGAPSGSSGDDYERALADRAAELGVDLRLLGTRLDVDQMLHASDIAAFPSMWEGFGLFPAEAGCAGVAVVASATGGITDVVVDGETGLLVPPGDERALRRALRDLASDAGRREQLGAAAVAHCRSRFDGSALRAALREVYP